MTCFDEQQLPKGLTSPGDSFCALTHNAVDGVLVGQDIVDVT